MALRNSSDSEEETRRRDEEDVERFAKMTVGAIAGVAAAFGLYSLLSDNSGLQIEVVETRQECNRAVRKLSRFEVLGFDYEWVRPEKVALIQLSSADYCALFRICRMNGVPSVLDDLLEDPTIRKVGVQPIEDAGNLKVGYGTNVRGTFDLRFLAAMRGYEPKGLAGLSESVLNKPMNKSLSLSISDWEAMKLDKSQVKYAADDAIKGIEIYEKLTEGVSDLSELSEYEDKRFIQNRQMNLPMLKREEDCVIQ